ncbi:unnamed protein product [Darwinula stevensoni]|uniref:receptor protein serine/threonine kinase n=1 Tax=Darwinula stevensoni TaxID=69355 RepID=A0A7R9A2Q8_9CRUS|nr:unnamed protein product [Darwinula stevensoni]CAG0890197.1 unnamed protein product [Darwinula stevensoni]
MPEPPAAIQNAMMKDKKPFTYTPGGLDLISQIKSPRMQKRVQRNLDNQGLPSPPPQLQQTNPPLPTPVSTAASIPMTQVPVLPPVPASFPRGLPNQVGPSSSFKRELQQPKQQPPSPQPQMRYVEPPSPQPQMRQVQPPSAQQLMRQVQPPSPQPQMRQVQPSSPQSQMRQMQPQSPQSPMHMRQQQQQQQQTSASYNKPQPQAFKSGFKTVLQNQQEPTPPLLQQQQPSWSSLFPEEPGPRVHRVPVSIARDERDAAPSAEGALYIPPIQKTTPTWMQSGPARAQRQQLDAVEIPVQVVRTSNKPGRSGGSENPQMHSGAFRLLQQMTADYADPREEPVLQGLERVQLSDDDMRLLNHVRQHEEEEKHLHDQETDPRYRGAYIPSRAFRMLQDMTATVLCQVKPDIAQQKVTKEVCCTFTSRTKKMDHKGNNAPYMELLRRALESYSLRHPDRNEGDAATFWRHGDLLWLQSARIYSIFMCCGFCPDGMPNSTCQPKPLAYCFTAVEEVIDPQTGDFIPEYSYGCLPPEETGLMQCKGYLVPHVIPQSIACCRPEIDGDFCNSNLQPMYTPTKRISFEPHFTDSRILIPFIVSILVCAIALILILHYAMNYLKRRGLRRGDLSVKQPFLSEFGFGGSTGTTDVTSGSGAGLPKLVQQTIGCQITLERLVGSGRFSDRWLGTWRSEKVLVKVFSTANEFAWQRETQIYQTSLLRHENILGFIASDVKCIVGASAQMLLITEYPEQGTLREFLSQLTHPLQSGDLAQLAYSLARGITHLHVEVIGSQGKPGIAHRDLSSANIYVKADGSCCIGNFVMAVQFSGWLFQNFFDTSQSVTIGLIQLCSDSQELDVPLEMVESYGDFLYWPPEALKSGLHDASFGDYKAADMYAVGLILWELLSVSQHRWDGEATEEKKVLYQLPFTEFLTSQPSIQDLYQLVCIKGQRPSLPPHVYSSPDKQFTRAASGVDSGTGDGGMLEKPSRISSDCFKTEKDTSACLHYIHFSSILILFSSLIMLCTELSNQDVAFSFVEESDGYLECGKRSVMDPIAISLLFVHVTLGSSSAVTCKMQNCNGIIAEAEGKE